VFSPANQGRPWSSCWSKDTTTALTFLNSRLCWCFHQQIIIGLCQVVDQKTQQRQLAFVGVFQQKIRVGLQVIGHISTGLIDKTKAVKFQNIHLP